MSTASWIPSLIKIAGADAVISDAAALQAAAVQGVAPACICAPADADAAAKVIAFAAEYKIPVLPRGGGTGQGIGATPPSDALCLSTRRMNKLIEHEPGDMVATVQAGMELGAFQETLAKNGQWLPLDGDPHSTIGGLIATDRSGPIALGYGTLRDMVLGMSVINGDGVLRKCGGKVVKNVTGYDLAKLYIGSLGTLGLVTEVTFKLRPLPIQRGAWSHNSDGRRNGVDILKKITAKNLPLELLTLSQSASGVWTVAVAAAGTDVELIRIGNEIDAVIAPKAFAKSSPGIAWQSTSASNAKVSPSAKLRFWCLSSQLESVLDLIDSAPRAELSCGISGGWAKINAHADVISKLSAGLQKLNVNYRWENVQGLKIDQPFGPPRPEWKLMKQIHQALDPQGIMNPGRFIV